MTAATPTKNAFRAEAGRHPWVHLATHGYYAPARSAAQESLYPELRSAIALAGASAARPSDRDGGILTALEVASLDLNAVNLAVVSACETGLGDSALGEGVLGLQRAFLLAGARTTITSLWRVDDAGTQALMVEFYQNLWEKKLPKAQALRSAQIALLRGNLYRPPGTEGGGQADKTMPRLSPYYWAAFVVSGDWR
jgi:CHAT domain-containing protein